MGVKGTRLTEFKEGVPPTKKLKIEVNIKFEK